MKIKGKVFKAGNSYGIRVSKLWVDSKILKEGQEIEIELPIEIKNINAVIGNFARDCGFMGTI